MGLNRPTQAHVRTDITDIDVSQSFLELALFNPDGTPFDLSGAEATEPAANVALITTPDATDLTTAQALANANKAKINAVIQALVAAGLMASA